MAVEARHLNLFPPQLLGNRGTTTMTTMNPVEQNGNAYQAAEMGYGVPLSGTTTAAPTVTGGLLPLYNSLVNDSMFHQKAAAPASMKSESTLTYNNNVLPLPARKRSRDSINPIFSFPSPVQQSHTNTNNNNRIRSPFSFLGHDVSLHVEQQQLDIDHLVSQHMERMTVEIEERRKRQARKIMEAIEGGVMKKLRAKEDEIEKIGKLNWALEERVKSLCVENQIWRDLAQTNEATANALRTNLEQVLAAAAQVKDDRNRGGVGLEVDEDAAAVVVAGDEVDDAQSCCGSSWEEAEKRTLAEEDAAGSGVGRMCRNCWEEESCVLLLPCRHLCLCTVCGSTVHICPVCKSTKNASVHVNMS